VAAEVGQIITTTETTNTDPWMLFPCALKAPATRERYIQRLMKFLNFSGYERTKEEKAIHMEDTQWLISEIEMLNVVLYLVCRNTFVRRENTQVTLKALDSQQNKASSNEIL
jgi:hypothetical protein